MSYLRNASSLIWPGAPGWVGLLVRQGSGGKEGLDEDQLEVTVYAAAHSLRTWRIKRLLRHKGYAFELVEGADNEFMRRQVGGDTGCKVLPWVFVAGRPVGGFEEIRDLERSGQLERLMRGDV